MTRIFTEGAEMGDVLFFQVPGGITNVTTAPRSGARHFLINNTSAQRNLSSALSEFYLRFGWRCTIAANAANVMQWRAGATVLGSIRINASGKWDLVVGSGTTATVTSSTSWNLGTWYLLELHVSIADSGTLELKVDGTSTASYSGDTKPGADTAVDNLNWTTPNNAHYIDDLALNDTNNGDGLNNNSWCGDGKIQMLTPNADGDVLQLTCSTGSTHYTLVDEVPPNTTDYNESATASNYDLYGLTNITLAAGETIRRIYVEARVLETTAAGDNVQLGIKSASEDWSSNIPVTTSYARYVGKDLMTDPADAGAWTDTKLNSLQAGMKVI